MWSASTPAKRESRGLLAIRDGHVPGCVMQRVANWTRFSFFLFVLDIVLGIYVGFSRLNQLRFIARDPLLTGILKVSGLPPQSTLWRFLAALHLNVALQILSVQQQMRERVWAAANVRLSVATLDTDTTVHTIKTPVRSASFAD